MRLSELSAKMRLGKVVIDSDFQALGKLNALSSEKTLIFLSDEKYVPHIDKSLVSAVVTTDEIASSMRDCELGVLVVENPKESFYRIHDFLIDVGFYFEKFDSVMDETASISPSAYVAPRNVRIGRNSVVYPNAVILENSVVGENCTIMSGTVIGSEGYEVVEIGGRSRIVRHAGWVIMKDSVFVEANTVVCKGLFPTRNTVLESEVTVDNLVHVAHGVRIGRKSKVVALAMLGGNTTIGQNVWIGPSAVITSGISVGDEAAVSLGAVVTKDVLPGERVTGNFAISHDRFLQFIKTIR